MSIWPWEVSDLCSAMAASSYGRESVSETYYTAHAIGGLYVAALLSFVNNPGFNRAAAPLSFPVSAPIWISDIAEGGRRKVAQ